MRLSAVTLMALILLSVAAPAHALWPFGHLLGSQDAGAEEFAPPPKGIVEEECEPIRDKIVELNQTNKWVHPFVRPRIGWLKRKYEKCRDKYREQEKDYLKHVELTPPPNHVKKARAKKARANDARELPPLMP